MEKKICSFLPAVTQIIYDLGLQDDLQGVTFECPERARQEKPILVRCVLEDKEYSSQEIDSIFSASKAEGRSLYYVEEELLQQIHPDIIFTQDVCEVCQIDTACTSAAIAQLDPSPELMAISPDTLHDVFDSVVQIARVFGKEEKAFERLAEYRHRIDVIVDTQRKHRLLPRRVLMLEWIDPLFNCGHWIPDQLAYAGGIDMLSNPGGDSIRLDFEKIRKYNPEVIVLAPCGYHIDRARKDMYQLTQTEGWNEIKAVQDQAVYLADFDLFTQPSASTLVDGISLLAALFHPEYCFVMPHLQEKVAPFYETESLIQYV